MVFQGKVDVEEIEGGGKLFSAQQGNQVAGAFEAELAEQGEGLGQVLVGLLAEISVD